MLVLTDLRARVMDCLTTCHHHTTSNQRVGETLVVLLSRKLEQDDPDKVTAEKGGSGLRESITTSFLHKS